MSIVDSKKLCTVLDIYHHMTAPSVLWLMKLAFQELCMLEFMFLTDSVL